MVKYLIIEHGKYCTPYPSEIILLAPSLPLCQYLLYNYVNILSIHYQSHIKSYTKYYYTHRNKTRVLEMIKCFLHFYYERSQIIYGYDIKNYIIFAHTSQDPIPNPTGLDWHYLYMLFCHLFGYFSHPINGHTMNLDVSSIDSIGLN